MTPYDHWKTTDHEGERRQAEAEWIDERATELRQDPATVSKAYEWVIGTLDTKALELAAIDLSEMGSTRILGSDALIEVIRFGLNAGHELTKRLEEMAAEELERLRSEGPDQEAA